MHSIAHGAERRSQTRMRCLKTGRVVLANGNSTLACRIRSHSDNGLRLVTDETALIPETFSLMYEPTQGRKVSQMYQVAWRGTNEVGVTVLGPAQARTLRAKRETSRAQLNHRYPV